MYKLINAHNEVPLQVTPSTIGIIGGRGAMGQMLAREFRADGYKVMVTGEDMVRSPRMLRRLNRALIRNSDVIIFSIPIDRFESDLREIVGSKLRTGLRGKLVLDVSSTKLEPMVKLCQIKGPSVIGMHPMFGPTFKGTRGLNVILCPALQPDALGNSVMRQRLDQWTAWIQAFWQKREVNVSFMSSAAHDRMVPSIQFDVLMSVMCYANTLQRMDANMTHLLRFSTPNSRVLGATMSRMLTKQMVQTYTNIAFGNPQNLAAADAFAEAASEIRNLLHTGDRNGFQKTLESLGKFLDGGPADELRSDAAFLQRSLANRKSIEQIPEMHSVGT